MNPKLLDILKKAKDVERRAKQFDSTDVSTLEANVQSRTQKTPQTSSGMVTEQPTNRPQPKIDINSDVYRDRVKESGLPPEIMKAMLDNPIQQPDAPGTFSMDEEAIREVNPNYGKQTITETPIPSISNKSSVTTDNNTIRKMIAEEIAKALPSIVEKYFDKKMIQENINVLKSLKIKRKTNNNRT
tara:strand:+ start:47 stop:604 length:558 start_codon:yes stop_codon:yes gene_type:complete